MTINGIVFGSGGILNKGIYKYWNIKTNVYLKKKLNTIILGFERLGA